MSHSTDSRLAVELARIESDRSAWSARLDQDIARERARIDAGRTRATAAARGELPGQSGTRDDDARSAYVPNGRSRTAVPTHTTTDGRTCARGEEF